MSRIIISVTNDLVSDQRVNRVAVTLREAGADVLLVGRVLKNSPALDSRIYKMHRMPIPFNKGFLFYACYNLWLFVYLIFHKADGLVANDLDTLPANYLAAKLKRVPLIFDSHEYFPEVPEVIHRKLVQTFWLRIEKMIVPKLKFNYTVCQSIANIYKNKYNSSFSVVRNLPLRKSKVITNSTPNLNIEGKFVIIYQGALNVGRGIELVMKSMKYLENTILVIAGEGDISETLHFKAKESGLENKIIFLGRLPLNELHNYTIQAHLGFSLEENRGLNYFYALPNKLFDYIQAGVPVITSDFPEMAAIVKTFNIGQTTLEQNPEKLAIIIQNMLTNHDLRAIWKENLKMAAEQLCWEKEKIVLVNIYKETGLI
jgi:glycosyltransferase involved in cell wall biosynthesis